MNGFRIAALVWVAALAASRAGAAAPEELYRRVTVLEDRVGRTEARSAYGVRLTVFGECGSAACSEEQVFPQVTRIDFALDHRELVGDEVVSSEDPMGTLYLALAFADKDLVTFRTELENDLRKLAAQSFVEPLAGWTPFELPFQGALASLAAHPTWLCFDTGSLRTTMVYRRHVTEGGGVNTTSATYDQAKSAPICAALAAATAERSGERIETPPAPRRLLEIALSHGDTVRLDEQDVASLSPRPEGVHLVKRTFPDGISCSANGDDFDQYAANGWQFDAHVQPADFPIAMLDNAWLHRFDLESVERHVGPRPSDTIVGSSSLLVAYLATLPAIADEPSKNGGCQSVPTAIPDRAAVAVGPPSIDRAAFLDTIASRLDLFHGAPADLLQELVTRPAAGLQSEDWIVVVCRTDGSAMYYVPPTRARQRVTNAELFCAALEARLGGH